MNEFIKKLKAKPEAERERVAKSVSIVFTVLVGLVFIYSFGAKVAKDAEVKKEENTVKPFQLLKNSISETYDGITASVGNAKSLNSAIQTNKNDSTEIEAEEGRPIIPLVVVEKE